MAASCGLIFFPLLSWHNKIHLLPQSLIPLLSWAHALWRIQRSPYAVYLWHNISPAGHILSCIPRLLQRFGTYDRYKVLYYHSANACPLMQFVLGQYHVLNGFSRIWHFQRPKLQNSKAWDVLSGRIENTLLIKIKYNAGTLISKVHEIFILYALL